MGAPEETEPIRRQEVLTDLGRRAIEDDDLDRLLRDVAAAVTDVLGTDCAAVFELSPDGTEAELREGVGLPGDLESGTAVPVDRSSALGRAARSAGPVVADGAERGSVPEPLGALGLAGGISVAIGPDDDPWGVLGAYARVEREFADRDASFFQNVANILASAVETDRARRRLEAEETLTDRILDTSPVGIVVYDAAGALRFANDRAAEILGRDREAIADVSYDDPEADVVDENGEPFPEGELPLRRAIEAGEPFYDLGLGLRRPSGERVWLSVNGAPMGTGGAIFTFEDVTHRRRLESELNELLDRVTDAMYALDEEWRFTYANERAASLLGRSEEELLGEVVWDVFPDAVDSELHERFREAMETQETVSFERYSEPLGVWAQVNAYPSETGLSVYFRDITERLEVERELRESEEKFRQLAEHLDQVVWMTTGDQEEMLYVNPAFEEVWGIDRERLYEDPFAFLELVHEADRERVEAAFAALPESPFEEEYRIVRPDGAVRWVHARGALVEDPDREVDRVIGVGEDVTDRMERERELERALDLLERTERIADVGGWEIDVNTRDVFWTDHIFELLEVDSEKEPPLEDALGMYHEEDRSTVESAIEEALASGEPFDVEARILTEAGDVRWLRLQGVPETADGEVVTLRGAVQDVTDRKERERELERRARQQQAVADLGQIALETDDPDELMREATRRVADALDNAYCKVLDLDPDEGELLLRQGVGWRDGIVGYATVAADENSQAGYTLRSEEPVVVDDLDAETRFSGPDLLTSHDVESGISTIIGSIDDPWGVLGTHDTVRREFTDEDVTFVQSVANVLAEAIQRHRYQAELEQLVEQLEASNERLEQFAYAASHDLQEPLRMVSSYLQLIESRYGDALDEDGEEFLEFAVEGADRMRDMIDGLLKYSRVETQGDPMEPVDLDAVVEDVLEDLQVKIAESDAEIAVEDLPRVEGDADQLRQVFQNLLSNAIEYSGDAPPRVRVTAERNGREWVVSVSDRGVGIDPADQRRIFEIFQRLHDRSEHPGTGIGLALVERIVERHGGEIWVDSEPGEGATFSFTLRAARGVPDE